MRTGGRRLAGGLRRGLCGRRPVGAAAVALDGAAGLDLGAGGLGQGLGAGVVDQAQVRAAAAGRTERRGRLSADRRARVVTGWGFGEPRETRRAGRPSRSMLHG